MRLTSFRITKFRSIYDSNEVSVGSVTCLVGKNESGKTAILHALSRLNSLVATDREYDATEEYPRPDFAEYERDVELGRSDPAIVAGAKYELSDDDVGAVVAVYGSECLIDTPATITLRKGYSNELIAEGPAVDMRAALSHLVSNAGLQPDLADTLLRENDVTRILDVLQSTDQTDAVTKLRSLLEPLRDTDLSHAIFDRILRERVPKFLYFDQYYQLKGQDNLEALQQRVNNDQLEPSDRPLLGLIELAGLRLDQLSSPRRTEALIARLEAAESRLTTQVLKYWSQNRHLRMSFDIRQANPDDPPGMNSGMNILGRIKDTKRNVSTPLGVRSQGFVWFFSFLAWYSRLRKQNQPIILLFDEPGLSLHGRAQGDLLNYFDKELQPHHQLIYSTHSPFMVDPRHFDQVRIVQDLSIDTDSDYVPGSTEGTEVTSEILDASPDSLFPLQGALGYDIHQTLFIGPNSLVVEGVSDLIYIQIMSMVLQTKGKHGLSSDWTITPVGGADKVPTFVALLGAQHNLNIATLIDYQKRNRQRIDNLYKKKLLKKQNVLTFAEFLNQVEADIEDMFTSDFYLSLVNGAYGSSISAGDLPSVHPRILRRIEQYLVDSPLPGGESFNHYRPAHYFSVHLASLTDAIPEADLECFQKAFDALNKLL